MCRPRSKTEILMRLLLLGCMLMAGSAHAGPPIRSCIQDVQCAALLANARILSQEQEYRRALSVYQEAFARVADPGLLVSIGRMQQKLGRYDEAAENYRRYLSAPRRVDSPELRHKAQEWLDSVLSQSAAPRAQSSAMQPTTEPSRSGSSKAWKSWWLWSSVGLVVATTSGLAIGLTLRRAPQPPDGVQIIGIEFPR